MNEIAGNNEFPTRDTLLAAIDEFRRNPDPPGWFERKTQHCLVLHEGEPYPPKSIYSLATGRQLGTFNTATALRVLRERGFEVVRKTPWLEQRQDGPTPVDAAGSHPDRLAVIASPFEAAAC